MQVAAGLQRGFLPSPLRPALQPVNKQEHQRHHLALEGRAWPEALEAFAVPLAHLAAARQLLNQEPQAELWIGYSSPLELLSSTPATALADGLARWAEQATAALELRAAHPQRCRLLNLTLLEERAIRSLLGGSEPEPSRSSAAPVERPALDVRLQLVLRHRSDLAHLYADLEGCCELLGRQPQFVLPLEPLHGPALAERCLESWGAEQRQREEQEQRLQSLEEELAERADGSEAALKEAREEAELTLLQLHQVQEELEHVFLEHRKAAEEKRALQEELAGLEQEALHLFTHTNATADLDHSRLQQLTSLAREALKGPGGARRSEGKA